MHAPGVTLGRLRDEARTMSLREGIKEIAAAYERNDLLTYANAIAFQVFFALIPMILFAFGLLGFFGLESVWADKVVPHVAGSVSPAAFELINSTVLKVLGNQQVFWVTLGLAIAVWKMSGAVRAVMGVFDRIYDCERERSFKERYLISIWLALITGTLFLLSVAVFMGGPLVSGVLTFARWPICAVLLFGAMAAFVRMAPSDPQPIEWVSFGSLLVVVAWIGTSIAFAFYVKDVASYGSVFGALSSVIIAFEYLYLSAIAFLTGAQLDALIRARSEE